MTSDRYPLHTVNLNIADWCEATDWLSPEQEAVYLRICMAIYLRGGPIPDDNKALASRCRLSRQRWLAIKKLLEEHGKIVVRDGFIYQSRSLAEIDKARARSKNRKKAADKRWEKEETSRSKRRANGGRSTKTSRKVEEKFDFLPPPSENMPHQKRGGHNGAKTPKSNDLAENRASANASSEAMQVQCYPVSSIQYNKHPADAGSSDDDLEAYTRGEDAAKRWLFDDGLSYLTDQDIPAKRARAVVGAWLKRHSAELVKEVIDRTSGRADVAEPIPYISAALKQRQQELEINDSYITRTDFDRALENWAGGNCVGPEPKREDFE